MTVAARIPLALAGLVCLALAACTSMGERAPAPPAAAVVVSNAPGLQGANPDGSELWLVPSPEDGTLMRTTVYRPPGEGPFPLAVVNHGSEQDLSRRLNMPLPSFPAMTQWLLARGYVVALPQRPGHGATGGRYLEDQGPCSRADFAAAGNGAADSIAAAIGYMTRQPFARSRGVLVVGNSAGGWGALALASRNPQQVAGVIAFAPGRGGRDRDKPGQNCSPERLIAASQAFGSTARGPVLMLYASNDTYFPRQLAERIGEAFRVGDRNARYRILPPVGGEGHALMDSGGTWEGEAGAFLDGLSQ